MNLRSLQLTVCYQLLKWVGSAYTAEVLWGDLLEEYQQRHSASPLRACGWLWRQVGLTLVLSLKQRLLQPVCVLQCVALLPLLLLPFLFGFICWLSEVDTIPASVENGWQILLSGQAHLLISERALWPEFWRGAQQFELSMFVHGPSVAWALFATAVLWLYQHRTGVAVWSIAIVGYGLAFLPYIGGIVILGMLQPIPQKVGPILAFMLLSLMYLLPVVSGVLWRRGSEMRSCE